MTIQEFHFDEAYPKAKAQAQLSLWQKHTSKMWTCMYCGQPIKLNEWGSCVYCGAWLSTFYAGFVDGWMLPRHERKLVEYAELLGILVPFSSVIQR